jgi:CRISPR-associated endonuclease/helicase Cas3
MNTLSPEDFPAYFEAVHKVSPFAWQTELAQRVLEGAGWPQGIDVPTGLGKTAVVDVAVFALAVQAAGNTLARTAPTRTFIVVDRRIIVDQSYVRAKRISHALELAEPHTVVGRVATALRSLSSGGPPLEVVRMRGGTTWAWRWLAEPAQPAVVVATVDQFGSRLLFRGYGVGQFLRPIDAALCGADSLLILDEAHLSQPLIETVRAAGVQQARAEKAVLPRRFVPPVLMSATLPTGVATFRPDLAAESSPVARRRLDATRTARLVELTTHKDPGPELAEALAALAVDGLSRAGMRRIGVVCNTVRLARQVFELLALRKPAADIALLIGRCRQAERDVVTERWLPRLAAVEDRPPANPIIAMATQTIEVGADLDVDLLITEAAPLDALLQRMGRLNRMGRTTGAEAVIVYAPARHEEDSVYGQATGLTWHWLVNNGDPVTPTKNKNLVRDMADAPSVELGPIALVELLTPELRQSLVADPPLVPVALGPVLDAWARTAPAPVPDQPVAPYLHGIGRPAADVLVCWRAGLPSVHENLEAWQEELRIAPVSAGESVSIPIWEAARFLSGTNSLGPISDLEGALDPSVDDDLEEHEPIAAVLVSSDGEIVKTASRALRPGDTVVLPSEVGGHDQWGWTGMRGELVPDVADLTLRRRPRLRLRATVLALDPIDRDGQQVRAQVAGLAMRVGEDRAADKDAVRRLLDRAGPHISGPYAAELKALGKELANGALTLTVVHKSWLVAEGRPRPLDEPASSALDDEVGDEDEVTTSAGPRPVSLDRHLRDVATLAQKQAALLGLPDELARAVELAGRAHDLGKADSRFQAMLHGGDPLRALASSELLAKSGIDPADRAAYGRARDLAQWPKGMRHEAISATLVAELTRTSPNLFLGVDAELVHHLVQSHHGRARPLLPPVVDETPCTVIGFLPGSAASAEVPSNRELVDWEGPARFARLGRRYGWWGLALLETIVRLADMAASESYEVSR